MGSFVSIVVVDTITLDKNRLESYSKVFNDSQNKLNDRKIDSVNISDNVAVTVHYKKVNNNENSQEEKIVVYSNLEQNSLNLLKQNSDTKMTMDRSSIADRLRLNNRENYENKIESHTSKVKLIDSIITSDFASPEIIRLSDSWKLDSERNLSSDLFSYVHSRDNHWTGVIMPGDYLRIEFEKNLTRNNDITIFARGNQSNGSIQVFEKGKDQLIAQFENVTQEGKYRVFLTSLNNTQNTFDLKVINNSIEFDYIVDPSFNTNPSTILALSESVKVPQKSVTATLTLSDKVSRSYNSGKDVVALSESIQFPQKSVTTTLALSDKVSRSYNKGKDVVALSESALLVMGTFNSISVNDTLGLSEKPSPSFSLVDILGLNESASPIMNTFNSISVNDTLGLSEKPSPSFSLVDILGLNESASPIMNTFNSISVNDTLDLSESAAIPTGHSNLISVNDVIALDDKASSTLATLNPVITVNPITAFPNSTITISGSDFSPLSNLEITYGNNLVITDPNPARTDTFGSFSGISFIIPQSSGTNIIRVTDEFNKSASTTFVVKISSGGDTNSGQPPSISSPSYFFSYIPLSNNFKNSSLITEDGFNNIPKFIQLTGVPLQMRLKLTSNSDYAIEHVAIYQNLNGVMREIPDSNTNIIYEQGQPIQISNADGILSNANVIASKINRTDLDVIFNMTFAKPMKTSDVILRIWDQNKNSRDFRWSDILEVVQATPMPTIPEINSTKGLAIVVGPQMSNNTSDINPDNLINQIKMWAGYSQVSISDSELLNYMGISGKHVPAWLMKTAKWVIDDEISTQDFVRAIEYLKNTGSIT